MRVEKAKGHGFSREMTCFDSGFHERATVSDNGFLGRGEGGSLEMDAD